MYISIKSEVDSRVVLYPLIRALWNYGSMLVVSSNKCVRRLIEDPVNLTCRNVTVIVDEEGAADDIYSAYNIDPDVYDFIIQDNLGTVNYDICIVPLGNKHAPEFDEDIELLVNGADTRKIHLIQFGTPVKKESKSKSKDKTKTKAKAKSKKDSQATDGEYRPEEKWEALSEGEADGKNPVHKAKFPTYDFIEVVEAEHKFPQVGQDLIAAFYSIFKDVVNVNVTQFRKEVQAKDDYSGYVGTVDSSWNE